MKNALSKARAHNAATIGLNTRSRILIIPDRMRELYQRRFLPATPLWRQEGKRKWNNLVFALTGLLFLLRPIGLALRGLTPGPPLPRWETRGRGDGDLTNPQSVNPLIPIRKEGRFFFQSGRKEEIFPFISDGDLELPD
jgi:hypothetical protein